MGEIFDRLDDYCRQDYVPFHMPGHKRNPDLYGHPANSIKEQFFTQWYMHDVTEIEGFDNLHAPEGMLQEGMKRAADLYHSEHSFYLINGSTAGVLAAISATVPQKEKLIMMRNSHKSAYHAAMLRNLNTVFLYSNTEEETGIDLSVDFETIQNAVEQNPDAKAVLVTSPTYEGISLDLKPIAQYLHNRGIALIVDAAHGAHFGMAEYLPQNAIASGADLVIHSLHKTLPAPTQTALLHLNGNLVAEQTVRDYLAIYQSSSPSYLLMAAIDHCIQMMQNLPRIQWQNYYENRRKLSERLKKLQHIRIYDAFSLHRMKVPELGKMVIIPKKGWMSGVELSNCLIRKYHIQPELAMPGYLLCIMSVMDRTEYYERLAIALEEIDASLEGEVTQETNDIDVIFLHPESVMPMGEAMSYPQKRIALTDAANRITAAFVCVYPPGQPLLVPGERVTPEMLQQIEQLKRACCVLTGVDEQGISVCITED